MKSAAEIIRIKGNAAAVAAKLGVPAGRVRVWACRGYFPRAAWPELSVAYPDLSTELLLKLERGRTRKIKKAE